MGLIKEGDKFAILSDILGDEDHLGDMDFKVCGTKRGVTALQMDIKIGGITPTLMHQALEQAKSVGASNASAVIEAHVEAHQHFAGGVADLPAKRKDAVQVDQYDARIFV